jgi:hypothetical protein
VSFQHKELAEGRWHQLSLMEQMAHIGSEVERALNWKAKGNALYCQRAFERALELFDLTLDDRKDFCQLKEIARARETVVDFFAGINQFGATETSLRKYFSCFTYAVRRHD